jgi:competence protein ComEC
MSLQTSRGKKKSVWERYQEQIVSLVLACLLLVFSLCMIAIHRPAVNGGELSIWFFDVGQGDAIFLELPSGEQILIDGGVNDEVLSKLGSVMWPTDRTLDMIIATHADADHITGLVEVLDRYQVETIVTNGKSASTQVAQAFDLASQQEGAVLKDVREGELFVFEEVELEVLWPNDEVLTKSDRNEQSVVVLVRYGETSVLLTGDAEAGGEEVFGGGVGDIDVLKVGHHGSSSSTSYSFLQSIEPEYGVVSCGLENRYNHPHPIVLDRLEAVGAEIYRTDTMGDIHLISTGGEPIVEARPLSF